MSAYDFFASSYDLLNTEADYGKMAEYIHSVLSENGIKPGSLVLDLGCGTGSLTRLLSSMGYDMTGIDISEEMLSCARESDSEGILYLCQDITEFELYGTVAATVCTMDTVNHITDKSSLMKFFSLVHNYLDYDGIFIFDVNSEYKFENIYAQNDYILEDEGCFLAWQNDYHHAERTADFYITLFEEGENGDWIRTDSTFSERCYGNDELCEMLAECGFEVISVTDSYSDAEVTEESQRICITAKRI